MVQVLSISIDGPISSAHGLSGASDEEMSAAALQLTDAIAEQEKQKVEAQKQSLSQLISAPFGPTADVRKDLPHDFTWAAYLDDGLHFQLKDFFHVDDAGDFNVRGGREARRPFYPLQRVGWERKRGPVDAERGTG